MRRLTEILFIQLLIFSFIAGCGGGGKEDETFLFAFKEEIIVNLAKEEKSVYLKVKLGLDVSSKNTLGEIGKLEFKVRDRVNSILSRQTVKSISTENGKENIKRDIKEALNKFLETGEVIEVYFYDFVSQ